MNPKLQTLFDEPEKRYLGTEELNLLSQYVGSLPERIKVYRQLRDQELSLMQQVADQLQQSIPEASVELQERAIKTALLVLRYSAMAMLLDDPAFVEQRLEGWLRPILAAYETQSVDTVLHELLNQQLTQLLTTQQMGLLAPSLKQAQDMLLQSDTDSNDNDPLKSLVGVR